jgi:hypothetical protein
MLQTAIDTYLQNPHRGISIYTSLEYQTNGHKLYATHLVQMKVSTYEYKTVKGTDMTIMIQNSFLP